MLISILQSDPNLLPCRLAALAPLVQLAAEDEAPGNVGAGYVSGGQALVRKGPGDLPGDTILGLLDGVKASAAILHLRRATVGRYREENTHPFRYKRWLMAHDGTLANFGDLRTALLDQLPPFLQRSIAGDTDSEHLFALFLAELKQADLLDPLNPSTQSLASVMARTADRLETLASGVGAAGRSSMNVVATNGLSMIAMRVGDRPMGWRAMGALGKCELCGLKADTPEDHPLRIAHANLRSVVVSTSANRVEDFEPMASGQVIAWDQTLNQVTI